MSETPPSTPQLPIISREEAIATGRAPDSVRAIQIETTSICNFRCPSCPLGMADYDRPGEHMSVETFDRVLDSYPGLEKLELQGIGEIYLNPCILKIIARAKERGIEVHTFSNASRIDRATAFGTVEAGLDVINFSMDGADEPTFRRARKGGTLERYRRCVTNLMEAREALQSSTPKMGAMVVLSKRNVKQIPNLLAIAEEIGMDTIIFTKMNAAANPDLAPDLLGREERKWIQSLPPYRGKLEVVWAYQPWTKQERRECYWPQSMSYVTVKGDVTPCCNYYDSDDLKLGNVFEQSGEEIWDGEAYTQFRRQLWSGDLPDKCRTC
ncbi:MAG: radical SAM protein with 4Fe4S-binding SPASM domain [Planctomycetota bacterium]|jgi:radical SAM protein with 4Fe4S-binding SPASM domain